MNRIKEVEHEDSDTSNEVSQQKEEVPHMEVRRGGNKKKFSGFVERTLMPALDVSRTYRQSISTDLVVDGVTQDFSPATAAWFGPAVQTANCWQPSSGWA